MSFRLSTDRVSYTVFATTLDGNYIQLNTNDTTGEKYGYADDVEAAKSHYPDIVKWYALGARAEEEKE